MLRAIGGGDLAHASQTRAELPHRRREGRHLENWEMDDGVEQGSVVVSVFEEMSTSVHPS